MRSVKIISALGIWACAAAPGWASTLPHADLGTRPVLGIGVGGNTSFQAGGGLSLDVPINQVDGLAFGGALNSYFGGLFGYDVRASYRLVEGASMVGPTVAVLGGIWGQPGSTAFQTGLGFAPYLGFALAYPINPKFDVRLDLCYAPLFDYTHNGESLVFLGGPPASGVEVGYKLTQNMEATLGINGRGEFLGASYGF